MDGSAEDYLRLLSCLPGFLLVVRPAGGSFFGGSPYGPVEWGGGGREKKGWNMNRMTEKTETAPVSATSAKARRFKTNK